MRKAKTEKTIRLHRNGVDSRNVFFDGRHFVVIDGDDIWHCGVSLKQEPESDS